LKNSPPRLELEAQAKLHDARGMGAIENQEARGGARRISSIVVWSPDARHGGGGAGTGGIDVSADGV
jgi:hypothetical protein